MTYAIRDAVLCDGVPGMICGKSIFDYNVLLLNGTIEANVKPSRLRPRMEVVSERAQG